MRQVPRPQSARFDFRSVLKRPFERFRHSYRSLLEIWPRHRRAFLLAFFASCLGSLAILIPWLGRDFFPA